MIRGGNKQKPCGPLAARLTELKLADSSYSWQKLAVPLVICCQILIWIQQVANSHILQLQSTLHHCPLYDRGRIQDYVQIHQLSLSIKYHIFIRWISHSESDNWQMVKIVHFKANRACPHIYFCNYLYKEPGMSSLCYLSCVQYRLWLRSRCTGRLFKGRKETGYHIKSLLPTGPPDVRVMSREFLQRKHAHFGAHDSRSSGHIRWEVMSHF